MTLLQPPPYSLPSVPQPIEVPEQAPAAATAQPQPILDLIRSIAEAEQALATQRNLLRRRVNSEPLKRKEMEAVAALAKDGEARARTARKRYRSVESGLIYHFPNSFDVTRRFDWRYSGDALLKLALSPVGYQHQPSFDDAVEVLTPDDLESYAFLRRLTRRNGSKGHS